MEGVGDLTILTIHYNPQDFRRSWQNDESTVLFNYFIFSLVSVRRDNSQNSVVDNILQYT
jgi:hypothetical protein